MFVHYLKNHLGAISAVCVSDMRDNCANQLSLTNPLQGHASDTTQACGTLSTIVTQIDWHFIFNLGIPALIGVAGWFFAHLLTASREKKTQRRNARITALEKAFMRLAKCSNTHLNDDSAEELERFVAEIQLYGTPHQIALMEQLGQGLHNQASGTASFDSLLEDLRDQLRNELGLEPQRGRVWTLRIPRS
jgi:hypothetical protein